MKIDKTARGFQTLMHPIYPPSDSPVEMPILQQSSAIDLDYNTGIEKPGSSFLWVGNTHHLNRKEVKELVKYIKTWLKTGKLD